MMGIDDDEQNCSVINAISVDKLIALGADKPSKSPAGSPVGCRQAGKVIPVVTILVHL